MTKYIFTLFLLANIAFANNLKPITIQLNWKHQFQFAGYYIAKEKGFYKDAGFNVKLKEFDGKENPVDSVCDNKVDYSISSLAELIRNKINGKDVISIFALFESSPLVFLVREDSNIKSIKDFKGKILQSNIHEQHDLALNMTLLKHGLTMHDLKIVPHTFDIDKIEDKSVDIITAYTTTEPFLLEQKNIKYKIFSPKDYGFDVYADILFTKANKDKDEINKIKEATIKGWKYALEHKKETINLILRKYNTRNLTKEFLEFEAQNTEKLTYKKNKIGHIDKTKVVKVSNLINLMVDKNTNINVDEFIFRKNVNINLTKEQRDYLKNKKEIKICVDPNWMPIEAIDKNGNYVGINKDYVELFEEKLSTKFNILNTQSWSQTVKFAKQRKCDAISLMMKTKQREKYFLFTSPYLKMPIVIATKDSVSFIDDITSLKDKKIGIPEDYATYELIKNKYPNLNIVKVKNIDDGLHKLINGDIFAYVGSLANIAYKIEQNHLKSIKISGKLDITWNLGLAIQNDNYMLFNILQKAVNSITTQEHKKVLNKWSSLEYEAKTDYTLIAKIVVTFGAILAILFAMYLKTKQLKDELEIAKNKAEENTKLKSQFLANMSHEIRTPINGIIGMSYLLKNTQLDENQKTYISNIDKSSKLLLSIVNDILDFSQIEANKMSLHNIEFNLKDTIKEIINKIKPKADEKNIEININLDDNIVEEYYADKQKLSQVLTNLLNNSVKFTTKGQIDINVKKLEKNRYEFSIKDTGIGINKDKQEKLFQAFSQADSSITREFGGTGLGLIISKELVQLMDGEIKFKSEENIGTMFTFDVYLEEIKKDIDKNTTKKDVNSLKNELNLLENINILLVEDNKINQEIIKGALNIDSISIDIANNGLEALKLFSNNIDMYDLIIMDIQMPIMDGYEATQNIRKFDKEIPIIAITANNTQEDIEKIKQATINKYIPKPINMPKLFLVILDLFENRPKKERKTTKKVIKEEDNSSQKSINIKDLELNHIDIKSGIDRLHSQELFLKIINQFYEQYKNIDISKLDDENLKLVTHTIKGLASNIGANELSKISAKICYDLDKEQIPNFTEELNKLIIELEKVININKKDNKVKDTNKEVLTNKQKIEYLDKLNHLLSKRKSKDCKMLIDEINNYNLTEELKITLHDIEKLLEKRDYKGALEVLNDK
jgi:signal transduction histidine kinase/ABC-type nitrate/sulfonate/bicarbonate transport system substrate-binding protein/CheY-like chemotaxis protein